MTLVLGAGALLAAERGHRDVVALIKQELLAGRVPVTHGGVVGQAWRGGRQARLASLLPALDVRPLDDKLGRQAGVLLGKARRADVIDAALTVLANDGDSVLTSDPTDLAALATAAVVHVDIVGRLIPATGRNRRRAPPGRIASADRVEGSCRLVGEKDR